MFVRIWPTLLCAWGCAQIASCSTVLAHFMVQNSYAYTVQQWETDMASASAMGVDGFALNWIPPDCSSPGLDWMVTQIDHAFTAADNVGFKLMYSFDMSYSVCVTYWNTTFMASMITKYAGSSAMLRWDTNILVSTYGGDAVEQYGNTFFQDLKNTLKADSNPIYIAPALTTFSDDAQYSASSATSAASALISDYPSIDGFLNWQAWPMNTKTNTTTTVDTAFQSALTSAGRVGPYIMAISPWQYKDLNDGETADSWVEYSDYLFVQRLKTVALDRFKPDIIELLTWNDYAESHYLRDLPSTVESASDYVTWSNGMQNYILGQDHSHWRLIAEYYLTWWKTGTQPNVTSDQVVFWYRLHPAAATCTGGTSVPIRNDQFPADAVFSWALVKSAATVSVTVGSNANWQYAVNSTPVMHMTPFPTTITANITPSVKVTRSGKTVASGTGIMPISSSCAWSNFNPVVNLAS